MPKFMLRSQYTVGGLEGAVREGFDAREEYVRDLAESMGATVEVMYWVYGEDDVLIVLDAPDAATAIALSFAINMSGAARANTTPLLTAAEMDAAVDKVPEYRPPGLILPDDEG